jgi:hypothetical protein
MTTPEASRPARRRLYLLMAVLGASPTWVSAPASTSRRRGRHRRNIVADPTCSVASSPTSRWPRPSCSSASRSTCCSGTSTATPRGAAGLRGRGRRDDPDQPGVPPRGAARRDRPRLRPTAAPTVSCCSCWTCTGTATRSPGSSSACGCCRWATSPTGPGCSRSPWHPARRRGRQLDRRHARPLPLPRPARSRPHDHQRSHQVAEFWLIAYLLIKGVRTPPPGGHRASPPRDRTRCSSRPRRLGQPCGLARHHRSALHPACGARTAPATRPCPRTRPCRHGRDGRWRRHRVRSG